jgi:Na+/H+ antiporter NhaD/arsenite permease-like protein
LLGIAAIPLVITTVLASNVGGTATLIGDPPNIMIGSHVAELSFLDFIVNLAPVSVLTLVAVTGLVWVFYRRRLVVEPERAAAMAQLDAAENIRGKPYLKRSLAILAGTVLLFFLHSTLHLEPAVVALTGATAMLLVASDNVEKALERVDWSTIFFFIGLFVMVGALQQQGVIARVADGLAALTDGSPAREALAILWGSAAGSALVDNIPFTAAMIPVVDHLQLDGFQAATWWALALGACFGGNATLIAAAANVAASGLMQRRGEPITFLAFLRIGLPATMLSLALATGYLLVFQL